MHNPTEQKKDKDASLSADKIRTQLNRILDHSSFADSERSRDFLRYVVEETLSGREKFIKGYTIALEVLNQNESFDPQMNSIVRMQAARLRRSLEHYYLTEGKNDEASKTHQTIDHGNYSLVSLLDCRASGILPAIFDNIHGHI